MVRGSISKLEYPSCVNETQKSVFAQLFDQILFRSEKEGGGRKWKEAKTRVYSPFS